MKKQKFRIPAGGSLTRLVAFLSSANKALDITVEEAKHNRSDSQNRALYGVAYKALSEFTGYSVPECHELCLRGYFGKVEVEGFGERYTRPYRTTTTNADGERELLSTAEFSAYYAFIQQKGAEIGCWVPDPDPRYFELREMNEQAA